MARRAREVGGGPRGVPALGLALLLSAGAAQADTSRDIEALLAVEHDNNVTFGARSRDEVSDLAGQARLGYRQLHGLTPDRAWGFTAAIDTRQYRDHPRLGRVEAEAGGLWRQRFGRGLSAPVLDLELTAAHIESRSDIRTGSRWRAGGRVSRAFSDKLVGRAGARHERRRASDGEAFDQARSGAFVNADYLLRAGRTLYGTLGWQTGDVAVTADLGYGGDNYGGWSADEPDDAFGGESADRYAFGVEADIVHVTLGFHFGLDNMRALDASIQAVRGSVDGGGEYDRARLRVVYLHRFDPR